MSILESLGKIVINLILSTGYFGIFFAMAIESCLIPLPSEVTMPFAGALASSGKLNLFIVTLAGGAGNLIGSWGAYYIGMKFPEKVIIKFIDKWGKFILLSTHEYKRAKNLLYKYGSSVSFFSRLLPGIRTVISLPCGVAKINFAKFSLWTFIGSTLWSFILSLIGYKLGENWQLIKVYFHKFDLLIIFGILVAIIIYIYLHIKKSN